MPDPAKEAAVRKYVEELEKLVDTHGILIDGGHLRWWDGSLAAENLSWDDARKRYAVKLV